MSDQEFHEIQLSGKQLVFLFMSAVVLAVVVFLLGVSVGRGVRDATVAVSAEAGLPTDTTVSTSTPPPTEPAKGELSYHDKLQAPAGGVKPPVMQPPAPPAGDPAAAKPSDPPPDAPKAKPEPPKPEAAKPAEKPAEVKPIEKPAEARPRPAPSGAWVVQVMALRSKGAADKLSKDLQAKGFPAFVANPDGGLFRVRVGPFAKRAEAEGTAGRLAKEGHKPSVQAR